MVSVLAFLYVLNVRLTCGTLLYFSIIARLFGVITTNITIHILILAYTKSTTNIILCKNLREQKLYLMLMKCISARLSISMILVPPQAKAKMHIDGDTVEDFYNRAHLDETRRKFLDGLKEGREEQDISPVEEKCSVMKKEINWRIEFVKKREIRPYSSLSI